jgi:hypothetical protein
MDAIALFSAAATSVQDIGRSGEARLSELMARRGQLNEIVAEQNRLRSLDDGQLGRAHSQQNQSKRWVRARVLRRYDPHDLHTPESRARAAQAVAPADLECGILNEYQRFDREVATV